MHTSNVFMDTSMCKCKADVVKDFYSTQDVQYSLRECYCVFRVPDRLWICPDTFSARCCYVSTRGWHAPLTICVHCE